MAKSDNRAVALNENEKEKENKDIMKLVVVYTVQMSKHEINSVQ